MSAGIEWIEKTQSRVSSKNARSSGIDVRVAINNSGVKGSNRKRTVITFYNDSDSKITHTDYMVCGVSKDKLYFKEEYLKKGYKVQRPKHVTTAMICLNAQLVDFVGLYILELDREQDLWYISKADKFGEEEV